MSVPIRRAVERVPGGMMVIPLVCGALVHTAAPSTAAFFGSFTGALFTGALPVLAVFYVCIGSTLSLRALPLMLRRGGVLLLTKIGVAMLAGVLAGMLLGARPVQSGVFAGISTLAIVAAFSDTNGGLYVALMEQYGSPADAGAYAVMALESGPFFSMLALGVAGLARFPWQTMLGAVLPLLVGIAIGNLDPELRDLLGRATPALVPFFAFELGATLNLRQVAQAGLGGVLLGLAVLVVSGCALLMADRLAGGNGTAGLAAATTAGNAAAVPALIAAANPRYSAAAGPATVLVASSVIVTAFLAPPLTAWWRRRVLRGAVDNISTGSAAGTLEAAGSNGPRIVFLADDLSGAADCAIGWVQYGLDAVVVLQGAMDDMPAEVLAIDADTRHRSVQEAAEVAERCVALYTRPDTIVFRKLDSTLRGHVGAELAATLAARRKALSEGVVAILAPAFPASGRTTVEGRQLIWGEPLEATEAWLREDTVPMAHLPEIVRHAGLRPALLRLVQVRGPQTRLEEAMEAAATAADVLICDAETDQDLLAIANASMCLGRRVMWAGSAGLAHQLPRAFNLPLSPRVKENEMRSIGRLADGPTLFVVGSVSPVSRAQAAALAKSDRTAVFRLDTIVLMENPHSEQIRAEVAALEGALEAGYDVVLLPSDDTQLPARSGRALSTALAELVAHCSDRVGALVVTGGETARTVLTAWGIQRLRLIAELEPGLSVSITERWHRSLPVLTKAGGFGRPESLLNSQSFLRRVNRTSEADLLEHTE